jgi:hypothetical protein
MAAVPARTSRLASLLSERSKTRALVAQLQSAAARIQPIAPNAARDYNDRAVYFEVMVARLNAQISTLGEG